jgi:hypothetical protein
MDITHYPLRCLLSAGTRRETRRAIHQNRPDLRRAARNENASSAARPGGGQIDRLMELDLALRILRDHTGVFQVNKILLLQAPERRQHLGGAVFVRGGNRHKIGHGSPPFMSLISRQRLHTSVQWIGTAVPQCVCCLCSRHCCMYSLGYNVYYWTFGQ